MLDQLDKKILQVLEINARQSKAKIAEQLGVSKTVITYRVNRLEKNGIIKGYKYISNQAALGLLSFGLLIKFQGLFLEEQAQILNRMRISKKCNWVAATNGNWDAIAVVIDNDVHSFNKRLDVFFAQYGKYIKEYNFYIDYEGSVSGLNYLYAEPYPEPATYQNPGSNIILGDLESLVYRKLQRNPQLSLLSIAKQLDKTYDTIKGKYQALITKGILLKAVPVIGHEFLGYTDTICMYNIAPNPERISKLLAFCAKHPNIVRFSRCLGHINLILNVHSRDGKHLKEIIGMINKQFSDIIISYDLIQTVDM
ncbi:MAG TPA: winged helix-turn-helix transcriptional regulator [Candidatus Saccharimonadales bacterium]|nr:winged helix-turn-helix transcriptional regulator [Candidatus Saccharimonadales bacterium]